MTIRIIDEELVLTRAEYNEYMGQYNELAARTQVCIDFEVWVRSKKRVESTFSPHGVVPYSSALVTGSRALREPFVGAHKGLVVERSAAKPEDEGMRVWG